MREYNSVCDVVFGLHNVMMMMMMMMRQASQAGGFLNILRRVLVYLFSLLTLP